MYADAKRRGVFRSIPRTEGVSTTEIVGRMLHLSRDHHHHKPALDNDSDGEPGERASRIRRTKKKKRHNPNFERRSQFLTTSRMLRIFSTGIGEPAPGAKVVSTPPLL